MQQLVIPMMVKQRIPIPKTTTDVEPLTAYLNHGRWLVKCECGGAELAWDEGRFLCMSCWNAAHGHQFRPSAYPAERERIETLLNKRPVVNQNWRPGEAVELLEAENDLHAAEMEVGS